jgi:heat shock protein HslJ
MKTIIIWVVLIGALIATLVFLLSMVTDISNPFRSNETEPVATSSTPMTFDQATVYTCAGGSVVASAFKTGDTTVMEVSLPNTDPMILTQTEAASGARYNNQSGFGFWEQGGVVLVEKAGEVIYADCKVVPVGEMVDTATTTPANELTGTQWIWNETSYATATSVEPNEPEDFVLTFAENNRFSANTDCNNVGGGYVGGTDGDVAFTEMVSTLMACEGDTKEGAFVAMLTDVVSYRIEDSQLVLSIKNDDDNAEMKFTKK